MPLYNSDQNNIYAALEQAYKEMLEEGGKKKISYKERLAQERAAKKAARKDDDSYAKNCT